MAINPGISTSANQISFLPHEARLISLTLDQLAISTLNYLLYKTIISTSLNTKSDQNTTKKIKIKISYFHLTTCPNLKGPNSLQYYKMSAQLLDFTVTGVSRTILSGSYDKLYQKNNSGFLVLSDDGVKVDIVMKAACLISLIQIKIINVAKMIIEMFGQDHQKIEEEQKFNSDQEKVYMISPSIKKLTKYISIRLNGMKDKLGMSYVILKGERPVNKIISKMGSNVTNKSEVHFETARKSPHSIALRTNNHNTVFSERVKTKEREKQAPSRVQNEEEELKRVIELSRKEAQKSKIRQSMGGLMQLQEDTLVVHSQNIKKYNKIDFSSCKNLFTFVNSKWLEAQRRAEVQFGVNEQERLSKRIKIKHLFNKQMVIDISPQAKKQQLVGLATEMGAKIISEVKDKCILITNRNDTERVSRARKLGSVAIVNQRFIEECHQCDALLDIKDYYLKL